MVFSIYRNCLLVTETCIGRHILECRQGSAATFYTKAPCTVASVRLQRLTRGYVPCAFVCRNHPGAGLAVPEGVFSQLLPFSSYRAAGSSFKLSQESDETELQLRKGKFGFPWECDL